VIIPLRNIGKLGLLTVVVCIFSFGIFYWKGEFEFAGAKASAASSRFAIPVLVYHSVSARADGEYNITPAKFAEQMGFLARRGYRSITMAEFKRYMHNGTRPDGKLVLLTFDDGYENNYTIAYPVMRRYGFVGTMFMITGWAGSKPFISWDEAARLQRAGWDMMPHTVTHPQLPLLSEEQQLKEIVGSKKAIERHLGTKADVLAYPYGHRSQTTYRIVRGNGFAYAFTFDDGMTTSEQDPYLLKRIIVTGKESLAAFAARLTGGAGEQ
jgi:peptidoglycan/xylan/chitin deacetylase (PgdA/CDA1 family)